MRTGFSTWLCPTDLDRARLLDNSVRIRRARTISAVAVAGTLASFAPQYGLWTVLLFAVSAIVMGTVDWRCARSPRPQLHIAALHRERHALERRHALTPFAHVSSRRVAAIELLAQVVDFYCEHFKLLQFGGTPVRARHLRNAGGARDVKNQPKKSVIPSRR
jgi:hypothetical protein